MIQTAYRRWHAKRYVDSLREQKKLRLDWEEEQELLKIQEKEEWIRMDYYRRHNPKTTEDFELLYNALERKCRRAMGLTQAWWEQKKDTIVVGVVVGSCFRDLS